MFDSSIQALEEIEQILQADSKLQDLVTPTSHPATSEQKLTVQLDESNRAITEAQPAAPTFVDEPTKAPILIKVPARNNHKLTEIIERVNQDIELQTLWKCANINAVDRLGISDHGRVHVQIVSNIGLKMLRLLIARGITPSIVQHHHMTNEDAEIVVVMAALMHDIGICIHRDEHEHHSLWLAERKVRELLDGIYDIEGRTIMMAEILHAIIAHARSQRCLTIEAGVVKVADALDMAKGRSRIPLEAGHVNIHSISAAAIKSVELSAGEERPIHIRVNMGNSAGIYQIDELLKKKIENSSIKNYLELVASIEAETEERLVQALKI